MQGIEEELMSVFRDEVAETLDQLATGLEELKLGNVDDLRSHIDTAFRNAHNLKGAARMVGQETVVSLTHAMEDTLSAFRQSAAAPSPDVLEQMLRAVILIQRIVDGEQVEGEAAGVAELIRQAESEAGATPPGDEATAAPPVQDPDDDAPPSEPQEAPSAARAEAGEPVVPQPPPEVASEPEPPARAEPARRAPDDGAEPADRPLPEATSSVRVEVSRLDRLMAHIGELPVLHARLSAQNARYADFAARLVECCQALPLEVRGELGTVLRELDKEVVEERQQIAGLGHLSGEIVDATKRVRMMPLNGLAQQWRRIVRESAREVDKDIEIKIQVGDIELDKHILDSLRDPIMHLLRNAVDHGIELPDTRVAAGKSATGQILVKASLHGTRVTIEVSDDGAGLRRDAIAARAVEKQIVQQSQLDSLSDQEVEDFLFAPGFSTATTISQLSGRGVGLDVVRSTLRELGGDVCIEDSPDDDGTTFALQVPASLVSSRGLLVRVGDVVVALTLDQMERTVLVSREEIISLNDRAAISLEDGTPLEVSWLDGVYGEVDGNADDKLVVVVLRTSGGRRGIVVNELLGETEFITKRLPWNLKHVPGVSGAVILADGTLAVVLDVSYVAGNGQSGTMTFASQGETTIERTRRILVVDDSLTSRTLEKNILQSAGYEVTVATDGEEGWETLQREEVDLVVSDVEMPRCTGLELASRIRASDRWTELPLILVTSLGNEADLAAGARVGADEYIVKGQFDQRQLLESVARLL